MSKVFIISDCHGNYEGLVRALHKAKIIDNHGNRQLDRRHQVYSIGDLANCVEDSIEGDRICLDMVGEVIDGLLIGNHEIPYFDATNTFGGFYFDSNVSNKLHELREADLIGSSLLVGNTLVSHAGVSKQIMPIMQSALDIHNHLEDHWNERNYSYSYFRSIGKARYGRDRVGGILWCDFDHEFTPTDFPQIVGHTPKYVRMKGNSLCIDVGAKDPESEPFILELT